MNKKDRLDALDDVLTMPAIKFGLNYENVIINDGRILSLKKREKHNYITGRCGRRYVRLGF